MLSQENQLKKFEANWEALEKADKEAKEKNEVVGRFITHPFADGQAVYVIKKVTKKTATIRVQTGLGDDWILPAWGGEAVIPLATALEFLRQQDSLSGLLKPML